VKINGMPAARLGDSTTHGGMIITGFPTVLIGDGMGSGSGGSGAAKAGEGPAAAENSPLASGQALTAPLLQAAALRAAAASAAPFCEACRREQLAEQAIPPQPPIRTKDLRPDLGKDAFKRDGTLAWPPNDGFDGPLVPFVLRKGMRLDRYSKKAGAADSGAFLSVPGTPYPNRALPYEESQMTYTVYEVVEDIPAMSGSSAPAFGMPGRGIQYRSSMSIKDLLKAGKIRVVK
jgi:hypothetical protein